MDFSKIEKLFLFIFVALNLFLGYLLIGNIRSNIGVNSNLEMSIQDKLAKDQVKIDGAISDEHAQGYYLSAERYSFKSDTLDAVTTGQVLLENVKSKHYINDDHIESDIENLLEKEDVVYESKQYKALGIDIKKDNRDIIAHAGQSYKGIIIYDDFAQITFNIAKENGVFLLKSFNQTMLTNFKELREKQDLISENEALDILYDNNKLPVKSTIKNTLLAYTKIVDLNKQFVFVPVWYVTLSDSTRLEVNAINGAIITNDTI
ncbi:MAG: two-component system regulatory protein YycI [Lactobacillales bacterium]|jgi:regulatory protein YycI of two-component signal transduction system YycFG|nr:two-component system regulatory protein YycI [Lactobacillales bacterium]